VLLEGEKISFLERGGGGGNKYRFQTPEKASPQSQARGGEYMFSSIVKDERDWQKI
jgi:hypothetical protein